MARRGGAVRVSDGQIDIVKALYRATPSTVDELPYTEEFERLHAAFVEQSGRELSRHELWRVLAGLRKARRLGRKVR